jgi:hypothetical protein
MWVHSGSQDIQLTYHIQFIGILDSEFEGNPVSFALIEDLICLERILQSHV